MILNIIFLIIGMIIGMAITCLCVVTGSADDMEVQSMYEDIKRK